MSEHLQACEHYHSANEHETEEGDENSRYGINSERNDVVQVTDDDTLISNTTSLPLNEQIAPTQLVSNTDARDSDLDSLAPVPQPNETLEIEDSNRAELENSVEVDPMALPYEEHLRNAIDATLKATTANDDPVQVLRTFSCHFLRGRPLDVMDPTVQLEGETTDVFVTRENIYEDGMDELLGGLGVSDPSLPLEVTFTGECAQDLGGPRKEFLGAMTREIKDHLFVVGGDTYTLRQDVVAETRRYFFGAGLVFGYSMLQGGPLPCFMHEELLTKLFGVHAEQLNDAEEQLRNGFSKFGLVELIKERPSMLFLLRRTAYHPLTYPRIVKILAPKFSEQGSNKRMKENRAYRLFLNYVKEVAAGRRENVSLGDVLRFATGSEDEPVLGFAIQPALCFSDGTRSCLPTSNTCINLLRLAIGEILPESQDEMFQKFDLAFSNTHFGMASL
ncbi:uncharacterized protein LOC114525912 [Dendronephthya gigantea]|uniref:uncharacterized protein LOC114525912 n=1 Tax=Dendronephthya gigantea TaxID=151771 RepID=UPI001069001B|nr:uncharacterized protein LOC114525912 [Dendronephthya gigantea]